MPWKCRSELPRLSIHSIPHTIAISIVLQRRRADGICKATSRVTELVISRTGHSASTAIIVDGEEIVGTAPAICVSEVTVVLTAADSVARNTATISGSALASLTVVCAGWAVFSGVVDVAEGIGAGRSGRRWLS